MNRWITFLVIIVLLVTSLSFPSNTLAQPPSQPISPASPDAPSDVPTTFANNVASYTLSSPKLFWTNGVPDCPPTAQPENVSGDYNELIQRVPTTGGVIRTLYNESEFCNTQKIYSNLVADANFIYWLGPGGLKRLSTNANPGDPPELVNSTVGPYGQLAITSDRVYVLHQSYAPNTVYVYYIRKSDLQRVHVTTYSGSGVNFQADGKFVYFTISGTLYRVEPGVDSGIALATSVSGFYPEGSRLKWCSISPFFCTYSDYVFIGRGRYIYRYDNDTNTLGPAVYTSSDTTASVRDLATDMDRLYFIEARQTTCEPLCLYTYVLNRTNRLRSNGSPAPDALYTTAPSISIPIHRLTSDGIFLFWQEGTKLQRMPGNASALPNINMRITGIEVTQGIQNLSNSVVLIKKKRTFVRVYVVSDGTAAVNSVTALLSTPSTPGSPNLVPVNATGTHITVRTAPNRNDLEQSFLFELPYAWTQNNSLQLTATLNPYKTQLEPNYTDNTSSVTVAFQNSPTLSVEFFRLNYVIGGTTYSPRIHEDILATYSWLLRAYPIGGGVGENFKPRIWDVAGGTKFGSYVNQTHMVCVLAYPADLRNLCASLIGNGWLWSYRVRTIFGFLNVGLKTNAFYYGMVSDAAGFFPRGQAAAPLTSVGPSGPPGGWDTDTTYGDWYAAHEIGHSLGRPHPNAGSDNPATSGVFENCGHSRSDPSYPYGNLTSARAPIGPPDNSMEGFDFGDPAFGIARAVYPSSIWNDVMSYCDNQWISDYTYTNIYNYMISHPSRSSTSGLSETGDFLALSGMINPSNNTAAFAFTSRLSEVTDIPPLVPGDYSLRLLNSSGSVLATHAFTPEVNEFGFLIFGHVINFVPGTRQVQLIRNSDSAVLTSAQISANPPAISNVALQGAPNPVRGEVTLTWTASDPDGDALTFEVAYSRDGGTVFQPVAADISGSSVTLNTDSLGGSGTAILRVTASDGMNTASADSAAFVMENKVPDVYILNPAEITYIHYGQLVNFEGFALDAQDGTVDSSSLYWQNSWGTVLGTGAQISLADLPVGTNIIYLIATNSVGESASATVTVIVDDDVSLPGPTLSAGPTIVGWHVPSGTTSTQTASVSVNNSGSGTLAWTASSNAPWLTLNATSGTIAADGAPFTLILTAAPAGLADGTTNTAQVTLTMPASGSIPQQTIVIPVNLSIGYIENFSTIPPSTGTKLYLPMIQR